MQRNNTDETPKCKEFGKGYEGIEINASHYLFLHDLGLMTE